MTICFHCDFKEAKVRYRGAKVCRDCRRDLESGNSAGIHARRLRGKEVRDFFSDQPDHRRGKIYT
jgi:hypothetical protein